MISLFNTVCRRPHLPRETWLQDMMIELGVSLASKTRPPNAEEASDDEIEEDEGGEEEDATDDETVPDEEMGCTCIALVVVEAEF